MIVAVCSYSLCPKALALVDHMDKMDYIEGMTFDIEDSRRQARREVHVVLDALLPHLAY